MNKHNFKPEEIFFEIANKQNDAYVIGKVICELWDESIRHFQVAGYPANIYKVQYEDGRIDTTEDTLMYTYEEIIESFNKILNRTLGYKK